MPGLTKRLQLLLPPEQYHRAKLYAKKHKMSVAKVIRQAIDKMLMQRSPSEKKAALERLLTHELPVDDWKKMEQEIIKGATQQ